MKLAKLIFYAAAIWGIAVLLPHYFLENLIGRDAPPPITHPEYFYGFVGVGLAWQFAFLMIARDPVRYRLLMLPSIAEKWLFTIGSAILIAQGRVAPKFAVPVVIDFALGVFFLIAFVKTPKE
jgi:hypothetical protein